MKYFSLNPTWYKCMLQQNSPLAELQFSLSPSLAGGGRTGWVQGVGCGGYGVVDGAGMG